MKRKTKKKKAKSFGFPVLCLDPSLTAFGWVVVKDDEVLGKGCIKTKPSSKKLNIRMGDDRVRRISEINHVLLDAVKKHNVAYIVSEQPHGSQSSSAAVTLGISLALITTMANTLEIGLEWYSEAESKQCALGRTEATKQEMVDRMKELYDGWFQDKDGKKAVNEAVADSLAIHYVAKKNSSIIKYMLK
jgi:Holliday junction resolvasome RuvABC endonuclease subunit